MIELWPFQSTCKDELRQNLRDGVLFQMLCSPTGSGKTEIAMSIIRDAQLKGSRAMFVADRQVLVSQTSERFAMNGIRHGVAMGDQTFGRGEKIQICSAQTLERRGFLVAGSHLPDLVVLDEAHELRRALVGRLKEAKIPTIGMSATPFTTGLANVYSEVVNVTSTNQLIKDGYLSPIKIVAPDEAQVDVTGLNTDNLGEWRKKQLAERVLKIVGDIVPEWEKNTRKFFGGPVKTLAFTATVADAHALAALFHEAGYDFQVVSHLQSAKEKQDLIRDYKDGTHMGLISVMALSRGLDVPDTLCLIDAYPLRRSLATFIQRLGRLMRIAPGKEFGLLLDYAGNWLGFEDQIKAFFAVGVNDLQHGSIKPKVRQSSEQTAHMKCKKCGFVLDDESSRCPSCGTDRARKRRETLNMTPGILRLYDEVTGSDAGFDGDWWVEICALVTQLYPRDPAKARQVATAKYKAIFGKWPDRKYRRVNRVPHPIVKGVCQAQFQQWRQEQRRLVRVG